MFYYLISNCMKLFKILCYHTEGPLIIFVWPITIVYKHEEVLPISMKNHERLLTTMSVNWWIFFIIVLVDVGQDVTTIVTIWSPFVPLNSYIIEAVTLLKLCLTAATHMSVKITDTHLIWDQVFSKLDVQTPIFFSRKIIWLIKQIKNDYSLVVKRFKFYTNRYTI